MSPSEKCQFFNQYIEAIEVSGSPEISEIRELFVDILENPNTPPANSMHWPLFTFISKSLDRNVPLNWFTDSDLEERKIYNKVTKLSETLKRQGRIFIQDRNGEPVDHTADLMEAASYHVPHAIMHIIERSGDKELLSKIDHIHVIVDNDQVIAVTPSPNKEVRDEFIKSLFGTPKEEDVEENPTLH